jgi:hypothetical protein
LFFFFFIEEKKRKKTKKKPTKKMSRSEPRERVYALIDGERDYQDKQAAPGLSSQRWEHEGRTTVAGSILMFVYYVFLMCQAWVTTAVATLSSVNCALSIIIFSGMAFAFETYSFQFPNLWF